MHDRQHEDHAAARPFAGSSAGALATRLARVRAERESRRLGAPQPSPREQTSAALAPPATSPGGAAGSGAGAEERPMRPALPAARRRKRDGREPGEGARRTLDGATGADGADGADRSSAANITPFPVVGSAPALGRERWPSASAGQQAPRRRAASEARDAGTRNEGAQGPDDTTDHDEIAELRAQAQHAREELRAARRRGEREKEDYTRFAKGEMLKSIIPLVDDLERALGHVPAHLRDDPWVAGVALIGEGAKAVLRREGVERIDPHNQPFDPHRHEAVSRVAGAPVVDNTDDDTPEDDGATAAVEHMVAHVYQPGYILAGRVLRPARVQVTTSRESGVGSRESGVG